MRVKRVIQVILLLLIIPLAGYAQISVRIFARSTPATVVFHPVEGTYTLYDKAGGYVRLAAGERVAVTLYGDKIAYRTLSGIVGAVDSLEFVPAGSEASFSVVAPGSGGERKSLTGNLKIKSFPGSLLLLNITSVEDYLPGVVRAEAGRLGPIEYFRAQAVVARTYVYRNIDRHGLDGYHLCDDVHCQVYPGMISEEVIKEACRSTAGEVLTDSDSILIVAAFHANCGGVTASSADVWLAGYPYLISQPDPWCSYSQSSVWRTRIAMNEWNSFLARRGITAGTEGTLYDSRSPNHNRITSREVQGRYITSEEIRTSFGLRSAFFTLAPAGDSITVSGRGYGHGVGLCQDGARHMAEKGMAYDAIAAFYYPGTIIIDVKNARQPSVP